MELNKKKKFNGYISKFLTGILRGHIAFSQNKEKTYNSFYI